MSGKLPKSEYAARIGIYFFSRALIYALCFLLIILAFFVGRDYMNISVLLKDGMYKRACVVIKGEDGGALKNVFTQDFLDSDELLSSQEYGDYVIRSVNHSAKTDVILVFPWQNTVTVTLTERISYIGGELIPELIPEGGSTEDYPPPEWQDGVYRVTLIRSGSSWLVQRMETVELLDKLTLPSPSPEA